MNKLMFEGIIYKGSTKSNNIASIFLLKFANKTTGKTMKWIMCFSSVFLNLKVFFDKTQNV